MSYPHLRLDGVTVDPIQFTAASGGGNADYTGPNLEPGVQAPSADLLKADLTLASLDHANLSNAHLIEADLSSADLSFTNLSSAIIREANFDGANLRNADLSYAIFSKVGVSFLNVDATNANFSHLGRINEGRNSDFTNVDFTGSYFRWGISGNANLTNAIFIAADLSGTGFDLQYADLTGATYSTGSLSNRTLFPAGFDPVARGMVLVPEVSTGLMVGIGLLGMALKGKKRKRVR